jgi:nucleoid-associated protein YgaU
VALFDYLNTDVSQVTPETTLTTVPARPIEKLAEAGENVAEDAPPVAPETIVPRAVAFDEVRREEDGMTIIAGRAEPGASVQVLLDGSQITTTSADGQGKFVAITTIAPDGQGHVLSLLQIVGEETLASAEQIILAPLEASVLAKSTPRVEASDPTEVLALPATPSKARPNAPAAALSQPQVSENGGVAEMKIARQATEPEVKTARSVIAGTTSVPEAEQQPTPYAAAPKPQVALLKTTQEGVELLNVPRPEALENVALDTISYSDQGDVQLAGRAQSKTRHVQVYLNNSSVVTLAVDDKGRWRGDLPDVDEGIYTLRVDEVSQDGSVTSRVETPFKREAPEVLAEAAANTRGPLKQITVQQGATLWAIAQERYGDGLLYVNVFQANTEAIRDPDLIYPGQVFALPE